MVTALGMPLDQAGRLVSEVFFYATSLPAYALLASLLVRPGRRLMVLSLLLVSPQYLYWSRAFMIESTVPADRTVAAIPADVRLRGLHAPGLTGSGRRRFTPPDVHRGIHLNPPEDAYSRDVTPL